MAAIAAIAVSAHTLRKRYPGSVGQAVDGFDDRPVFAPPSVHRPSARRHKEMSR